MKLGKLTLNIGRPQHIAAVFLLLFLAQALYLVNHQQLSETDYRYARCGREMWERPSPLAGYFTTCGNPQDGTLAYRVAGLPLTIQRLALSATDLFRKPENRLYNGTLAGSTWESRHQLAYIKYLLHLPFIFFAIWLGGGLWWVCRRLFGNEGGALALALYCFSPPILRYAVTPNNEILALWGLYGLIYTAIGVAHALQGPRRKWKPRIALLTLALGLTAAAHLVAALIGILFAAIFMLYLADRRRSQAMPILIFAIIGAMFILFCSYSLRIGAFIYIFTGGAARIWLSLTPAHALFSRITVAPITIALAIALLLYIGVRRFRYFGNTAPLLVALVLLPLVTTQTITQPWLWALPFLFTFIGGVFSDALETRHRKLFLALIVAIVITQATFCVVSLRTVAS